MDKRYFSVFIENVKKLGGGGYKRPRGILVNIDNIAPMGFTRTSGSEILPTIRYFVESQLCLVHVLFVG